MNILDEAKKIVDGNREEVYGDPGANVTTIARFWSAYLDVEINHNDVCHMMTLLKMARLKNNALHKDSDIDACGYLYLKNRINEND